MPLCVFLVPFVACLDASASVELDVPCYRVDRAGGLDVAGPAGRGYTYSTGIAGVLLGGPRIALSGMRHDDELGTGTGWAICRILASQCGRANAFSNCSGVHSPGLLFPHPRPMESPRMVILEPGFMPVGLFARSAGAVARANNGK